jgi:hypothetical protein
MQEYQVRVYTIEEGTIPRTEWLQNDKLHRIDGPACEYANGNKYWYQNGLLHRLNGPAIEWENGNRFWYLNGQRHRTDGPAVEWACGYKAWYIEGKRYSEEQFNQKINPICTKTVVIDGVEYELVKK